MQAAILISVASALLAPAVLGQPFDILAGPSGCQLDPFGAPLPVDIYPASPWLVRPFLLPFANPATAVRSPRLTHNLNTKYTSEYYDFNVTEELVRSGIPACASKPTAMLLINKQFPGPLVRTKIGVQALWRFNNRIPANSTRFPGTEKSWGFRHTPNNLCAQRTARTGNPTPGVGRALSIHHHGQASVGAFDGSAEDVFCSGESKYYQLGHNVASTFFYHDHALFTTSESVYSGVQGMKLVEPCREPYNMTGMPTHVLQLNDVVYDRECQLLNDRVSAHHNNIFGDINLVNGIRWPVFTVRPRFVRFKVLNAAPSRPYTLQFIAANGTAVGHQICWIVGADGGFISPPERFPAEGLLTASAYRWDIVCDFRGGVRTLYLVNQFDPLDTTPPFFCYSHLLMRLNIVVTLPRGGAFSVPINLDEVTPGPVFNPLDLPAGANVAAHDVGAAALANARAWIASGKKADRRISFSFKINPSDGLLTWVMNNQGWDTPVNNNHLIFNDVGLNNVEIWNLTVVGGVHPVHIHLIEFVILSINGAPPPAYLMNASKDVIQVYGNVVVVARYGPNLGPYLIHCHNVVHEDREMMRAFLIRDSASGITSITALKPFGVFKDQGANCQNQTDCGQFPVQTSRITQPLATLAQEYLNRNYYNIFYPSNPQDLVIQARQLDPRINPWKVTLCT